MPQEEAQKKAEGATETQEERTRDGLRFQEADEGKLSNQEGIALQTFDGTSHDEDYNSFQERETLWKYPHIMQYGWVRGETETGGDPNWRAKLRENRYVGCIQEDEGCLFAICKHCHSCRFVAGVGKALQGTPEPLVQLG